MPLPTLFGKAGDFAQPHSELADMGGMTDMMMLILWVRSLELALGAPMESFLAELERWPASYRPTATA